MKYSPAGFLKLLSYYRFVIMVLAFLVWLTFFDRNNLITQVKITLQLKKHQREAAHYRTEIRKLQEELQAILNNPERTEQFVRENYYMKRPDEDIFLISKP